MPIPDNFRKAKLAAFLHDPPSKALDILTYTERSGKVMQAAGLGTRRERRVWQRRADYPRSPLQAMSEYPNLRASPAVYRSFHRYPGRFQTSCAYSLSSNLNPHRP